jgi:mono/diheme cytochrome c family protein
MKLRTFVFLILLAAVAFYVGPRVLDTVLKRSTGETVWRRSCAECHGVDGAGNTPGYMGETYADLRDGLWRAGGNDGAWESVITSGVFGKMPPTQLTPGELRAVVAYIHELRGERARGTSN